MTIGPISAAGSFGATVTNLTVADLGSATALTSDFETFLKMLTAQAKYQDPLEPLDSSEYASQLAQFSAVEQQVRSNELLEKMVGQIGRTDMAQYAGWIGMEAQTSAPLRFEGVPVTINYDAPVDASSVELVVYDRSDLIVQRAQLPLSGNTIEWAGVNDDGAPFEDGLYRFEVEAFKGETLSSRNPVETYSRIVEARSDSDQTILLLDSGAPVNASDVKALREPR